MMSKTEPINTRDEQDNKKGLGLLLVRKSLFLIYMQIICILNNFALLVLYILLPDSCRANGESLSWTGKRTASKTLGMTLDLALFNRSCRCFKANDIAG